uniref:Retrovirus-related Pol polyprotein from transposon TNT 1-94 n=1 Tax=Tanacetum cinerariifolium TaxID=118510 RepID=A0A6L2LRR0_TANCI|nr:retrovirus-related Pol polyprotein from transposon TNT 1-94 [Tanacetum cinerariifolium]
MASDHVGSDLVPTMALEHDSLSPVPQNQENVPHADETVTMLNELDLLFNPMFGELLNGIAIVVSKSSAVNDADDPDKRQQQNITQYTTKTITVDIPLLNIQTTPVTTNQEPTQAPTVNTDKNTNQAETHVENEQVEEDEFINIFCTPIHQSLRGIFINQAKYAQEILKKHGMNSCDIIGTPMATKHLDADLSGTLIDQTKYRSMVGALMYLTAGKPNIVHATCYCARYQAKPIEKHLTVVKRIFWYLKDTINMGLWYPKDTGFELTDFLDLDHVGCLDSCKSTSSGIQFLGGDKLVSWSSKKQDCTSMYSAEAKYVSLFACCAQVLWLRTQITYYGFYFDKIPIYHFIKEKVEKGIVELFFVRTEYQLADLFTKALFEDRFKYFARRLGMRCLTPEEEEILTNESARSIKH